ncbi:hypothetical protein TWF281_003816 [Arthrobotrys megalospora]
MSDPVNTVHQPSMECLRALYKVVLDPKRRKFWARVLKTIREMLNLYPFRVAAQITGVIMMFLMAIGLDESNLNNVIVRESVPLLAECLDTLQETYQHGYLSPSLAGALNTLKYVVSGQLPVAGALAAVAGRDHLMLPVSVSGGLSPSIAQTAGQRVGTIESEARGHGKSTKPLEGRLLTRTCDEVMKGYLEGLSGHTVNGGLITAMGFALDDLENEPETETETETDDLEEELDEIPYALGQHGDSAIPANPPGLFSTGARNDVAKPMVFTNDSGDALFERWKERAADPTKLNFDWGKNASPNSMKDFLQVTLTLFVAASTETRLRFISEYMLKDEYLRKLWECLNVKLPTDSINHPSPKYSDHVSTVIHIMSHPDVVNRREFQDVRKELSGMFASQPNYLYGILGYMKIHSRSKSKNVGMIEACARSVVLILEGVFKLVDPHNIPMEFRHEAKQFLAFAQGVENTMPWNERTDSLTTELVQSMIRADEKQFPESKPPIICSGRQVDVAREQAEIASGLKLADPTPKEIRRDISNRIKTSNITRPVESYLDENTKGHRQADREQGQEGRRARKEDEEGWDDGQPIIHEAELVPRDNQGPVQEAQREVEEEAKPMDDEEALQYLQKSKAATASRIRTALEEIRPATVNEATFSQPQP